MHRLKTLGGCYLERDGIRLDGLSANRKGLGLLALLAVAGDSGISREAAATYLWPESDEDRAASSLKQLVHAIRQQLGSPDVLLGPATLRLNSTLLGSDVADFKDALSRDDASAAVALYGGPFLDGLLIRGADTFERWAAAERATLAARHVTALETLAERAGAMGDSRGAVEWWRKVQAADPLSGRAAVSLMRALDAAGDRAGAIRHARVHEALLMQEVGTADAHPQVSALAAELASAPPARALRSRDEPIAVSNDVANIPRAVGAPRRFAGAFAGAAVGVLVIAALGGYLLWRSKSPGRATQTATTTGPTQSSSASSRSIAVLPFANTSGLPADQPFADGLTDELIGVLGQVGGLRVVPRTSAFALKGRGLDVRTMADSLGVGTVLEGSVRRAEVRLRITVTLVHAAENRVIWTETYDRQVKDVFDVQRDIASSVLRALQVRLAQGSEARPASRATTDHVAYELYLKGQFFRGQQTAEALQRSVGFFEQAVARDPAYARAFAGLADANTLLVLFGDRPPREGFAKARRAALAALALDSTLAQAHAALGHIEMAYDWNWPSAGARLERALQLDSTVTTSRLLRGIWLFDQRRFDESIALLQQALAADPLAAAVRMTLGRIYVSMREPEKALPFLNGAIELNPRLSLAHEQRGHALLQQHQPTEAVAAFERAAALSGVRDSSQLAYAYAVTGRRNEAVHIVETLIASAPRRYLPPFGIAMAYAGLGNIDEAFRWLEQGFEEHAAAMDTIAISTAFASLHGDPRWARLLQRMGLSA